MAIEMHTRRDDPAHVDSLNNAGSAVPPQERSLGELFSDLTRDTSELVRQELQLAKAEMSQKAAHVGKNAGVAAAGAAMAGAGLLVLLAAVVLILTALGMPAWGAALLVGALVTGVGAALASKGIGAIRNADLTPHQTVETLKEDARWAKEQAR